MSISVTIQNPLLDPFRTDPTAAGLYGIEDCPLDPAGTRIVRGFHVAVDKGYFTGARRVVIEADTLVLPRDFSAAIPGGTITLLARRLLAQGNVVLDVSGNAGESFSGNAIGGESSVRQGSKASTKDAYNVPAAAGKTGGRGREGGVGGNGGRLTIAVESIEALSPQVHFDLRANGGSGGRGESGGKGGQGATGFDALETTMVGQRGGAGGNGGDGGNGGAGGNGGIIAFCVVKDAGSAVTANAANAAGMGGAGGTGGEGGQGGPGGQGGRGEYESSSGYGSSKFATGRSLAGALGGSVKPPTPMPNGDSGQPGGKGGDGASGTKGAAGPALRGSMGKGGDGYSNFIGEIYPNWRDSELLRSYAVPSLEYRQLLLRNVKLLYLQRTEEALASVETTLTWLANITPDAAFFEKLAQTKFIRALTDTEEEFYSRMLAQRERFAILHGQLRVLTCQLLAGLDYFGQPPDWVPLVSLATYRTHSLALGAAAGAAETLYKECVARESDSTTRQQAIDRTRDELRKRKTALEDRKASLLVERKDAEQAAKVEFDKIALKEAALIREGALFVKALREGLGAATNAAAFSLVKSAAMVVAGGYTVGSAMKAGGALRTALASASAKLEGRPVEPMPADETKQILREVGEVKQIVGLSRVASAASALFSDVTNIYEKAGEISALIKRRESAAKDWGANEQLLKLDRDTFKARLTGLGSVVDEKEKAKYWAVFNDYLDSVEAYAAAWNKYRGTFLAEARLSAEHGENGADLDGLARTEAGNVLIGQPGYRTAVTNLYFNAKTALQEFLYQERQAYRYWALDEPPPATSILGGVAEMRAQSGQLAAQLVDELNRRVEAPQSFTGLAITLTPETHPEQFKALRAGEPAAFRLDETVPAVAAQTANKANIRVGSVHVHLPGLCPPKGRASINFRRGGQSNLQDRRGRWWWFSHMPTHGIYEYESAVVPASTAKLPGQTAYEMEEQDYLSWLGRKVGVTGPQVELVTTRVDGFVGDNVERIMPSLFGSWEIQLRQSPGEPVNAGLDLGRIDQVVLIFSGKAQAFAAT